MRLRISRADETLLLDLAADAPGCEVCGLVFGDAGIVEAVVPVANVAADPARHFEIDPAALFEAIRCERNGGPKLLGYFHSHPSGPPLPSATDIHLASGDDKFWLIIGEGKVKAWQPTSDMFAEVAIETVESPSARD
ncbi:MAG: M67 family metallopeptidase [Sphingomonadaceae bacterium]